MKMLTHAEMQTEVECKRPDGWMVLAVTHAGEGMKQAETCMNGGLALAMEQLGYRAEDFCFGDQLVKTLNWLSDALLIATFLEKEGGYFTGRIIAIERKVMQHGGVRVPHGFEVYCHGRKGGSKL